MALCHSVALTLTWLFLDRVSRPSMQTSLETSTMGQAVLRNVGALDVMRTKVMATIPEHQSASVLDAFDKLAQASAVHLRNTQGIVALADKLAQCTSRSFTFRGQVDADIQNLEKLCDQV